MGKRRVRKGILGRGEEEDRSERKKGREGRRRG